LVECSNIVVGIYQQPFEMSESGEKNKKSKIGSANSSGVRRNFSWGGFHSAA